MPICFGEAAKFARFMLDAEKGYRATLKLGQKSSTGDTEGDIIETRHVAVDREKVDAVLSRFMGAQTQIPPMHSALKQDGVALYKLARQGLEVARAPREIEVLALSVVSFAGDELVIDTRVTKGTYIRVLAEDIGEALGCGAYLTALRRTSTGGFGLEQAITLESLDAMTLAQRDATLLPADALAMALPRVVLDAVATRALQNGQIPTVPVPSFSVRPGDAVQFRAYGELDVFLGVATTSDCSATTAKLTALRLMSPESPI